MSAQWSEKSHFVHVSRGFDSGLDGIYGLSLLVLYSLSREVFVGYPALPSHNKMCFHFVSPSIFHSRQKDILFGPLSFYLVSLHFNRFTQHKHKDQGLSVFATICYFQVANVSSSSMLRHYSLSGFGSLGVLYIGILPAVSPVRLECIFAKVAVRINEDSLVHFICRNCSMSNTFCCKSASNGFREDRMKTAEILWMEEDKSIV